MSDIDSKTWAISEAFIKHHGPVSDQLSSFNCAVEETIPSILNDRGTFTIKNGEDTHVVSFTNLHFQKPTHKEINDDVTWLTPKMCHDRSISYISSMYCDIVYTGPHNQGNVYRKKHIGDILIPVKSKLCNLYEIKDDKAMLASLHEDICDPGGYYIVKGSPKALIPQVRPSHNSIHIYVGKVNSTKGKPKFSLYAETRSGSPTSHTTNAQVGIDMKSKLIGVVLPHIEVNSVPLGVVFRALGAENEEEMSSYIFQTEWFMDPPSANHRSAALTLVKSFEQSYKFQTQDAALEYIGKFGKKFKDTGAPKKARTEDDDNVEYEDATNAVSYAKRLLTIDFLPHIGVGEIFSKQKMIYMGYMVRKLLLCHTGLLPVSDRDHFANKRIHTAGMLISSQFYKAFKQLTTHVTNSMKIDIKNRVVVNIASYISTPLIITRKMISAISSNKWANVNMQGISQQLDEFNAVSKICFLRKFVIPMENEGGKIEPPRYVHGSQQGVSCPYETPEGKRVGLVQGLAIGGLITIGCDPQPITELLSEMDIVRVNDIVDQNDFLRYTRVFINGSPQGYTHYPAEIVNELRKLRRSCGLPEVSIAYDDIDGEIRIITDAGRACRGVMVLDDGKMLLTEDELFSIAKGEWCSSERSTWITLLEKGYVEIIGKDEEDTLNVATYPSDLDRMSDAVRKRYSVCEMSPDMMEGAGVSTSPFNDSNQAPRNIYQASMAKQSIGMPGMNYQFIRRGKWHALVYPQKPLVSTRISKALGFDDLPMGQNATIVVAPWKGMNQEDSLIMNEDAVNRGFLCSWAFVAYEAVIKHLKVDSSSQFELFEIPDKNECNDFRGNPSKLKCYTDDNHRQWCYVPQNTEVQREDMLIGMTVTYNGSSAHQNRSIYSKQKTNISVIYDQRWPAIVHSIQTGIDGEGYIYIRLVTRQYRKPVRGDKFAARHGQKGTVGELVPTGKMPFLKREGYTPNIMINPLAFPSRMTIGLFIENILGVALSSSALKCPEYSMPLCLDDTAQRTDVVTEDSNEYYYPDEFVPERDYSVANIAGDGTPFARNNVLERIKICQKAMGLDVFSDEIMINPETGEELKVLCHTGVVYYQRLKHMVVDKIHARSYGGNSALHHQPTEGRKKKGGFRYGHMERDRVCTESSEIGLREGLSVQIGKLAKYEKVWGMNVESDGLVESQQVNFSGVELRTNYVVILQDGRTINAAKHHPFYTQNGDYSEVMHLRVGEDRVACSISNPLIDFDETIEQCKDWIWTPGTMADLHENQEIPSTYETMRRSLCLARLVGMAITDGHVAQTGNHVEAYAGHYLDADSIKNDVFRITGIMPKCKCYDGMYTIRIPKNLAMYIRTMGVIKGAKVTQEHYFPDFINDDTPLPILREFLGGLFGGDGHTLCLSKHRDKRDLMKSVAISWTRDKANLESLTESMHKLQKMLLRFDIESTIQAPKLTTDSKQSEGKRTHYEIVLNIPLTHLIRFSETIGFRYCEHKSVRLAAGVSYRRFREGVLRQRQWLCNRVNDFTDYVEQKRQFPNKVIKTGKALDLAVKELSEEEAILHEASIPKGKILGRILLGQSNNELRSETFPTVEDYLKDIGAMSMFLDVDNPDSNKITYGTTRGNNFIPVFYLKVIGVFNTHEKIEMCDITVKKTESYLANGIVAHNCTFAQGTPEMAQDRLFYQSDAYTMAVCQICGLPAIDDGKRKYCNMCSTSNVKIIRIPYGTKLLQQELGVMNLVPRIITLPTKK